ncbi:MAG: aminoacetone oxidase family FAD-binding enzyme [Clostridia bacterium]|nr:aminoacetone oxidase family FAD-binding enzyme [Clostridia bacterium]
MKYYDVAIIGGGASGLACAAILAKNSRIKAVLIDAGERLGKKLASTGNGQGNLSNVDMTKKHYHGGNIGLAEKIACGDSQVYKRLFNCMFISDDNGRVYPAGKQASSLCDMLIAQLGNTEVIKSKALTLKRGFEITLENGETVKSGRVILCVGGKAQKQFKTDGTAYKLATDLGHTLTGLYPSLVQLKTDTKHIKTLKGIRADCEVSAEASVKKVRGDVIFTDYGVSGNAIFAISPYVADKSGSYITLSFLPEFDENAVYEALNARLKSGVNIEDLLCGTLHNQLGRAIMKRAASDDLRKIVATIKNFTLPVLGTLGFDYAQVTKGGVNMKEVTDELESKIVKNLFFAGEVLDVDGDCGGYNLQWAFASGMAVADEILKRV